VDVAVAGFARPAGGPLPPENPLAYHLPPEHLPSVADSLLDAAGWRRGSDGARRKGNRPLAAELLTVGSGDNAVEQLVQADLAARGFAIEIRQLEMGAFLARARGAGRAWDLLYTGIPGDLGAGQLAAMFDSRQAGGALDYAGFHTARLDTLFARTGSAADASGRRAAWHAVQQELARELPVTWVYHARGVQGVSRRLRNVTMDLRGELPTIARWTLADPGA